VPLHVTDTPHGLELRMAGAKLIEVPELALLQQVLASTVSRELVSHPAGEKQQETLQYMICFVPVFMSLNCTHVPQLTLTLPTLSVKP